MPADLPLSPPQVTPTPLRCDLLTLFPAFFDSPLSTSIVHRARQAGILEVGVHDIRDHTTDRHRSADDTPYGGGAGMVMKPGPVVRAIEAVERDHGRAHRILLTPQGEPFSQTHAHALARHDHLMFICGRYEGIDERVREHFIDRELSIGDYVLTGGEPAAVVVLDAVVRLRPGALGNASSAVDESFAEPLLEYPQYTRPHTFREHPIPEVLLSGHHGRVARWRREQSLLRTLARRPDLLRQAWPQLPDHDQTFLRTEAPESLRLALREVMTSGTPTPAGSRGALSSPSSPPAGALNRPRRPDDE